MTTKVPQLTDLRSISRNSTKVEATVSLVDDTGRARDWIRVGESNLRRLGELGWQFGTRMDATDPEHDACYAVRLALVGLQISPLGVWDHKSIFNAWVDSNPENFHVPLPGYNPLTDPKAHAAKCKECKGEDKHVMLAGGFYVPPFNQELFEMVRGKRVEIVFKHL